MAAATDIDLAPGRRPRHRRARSAVRPRPSRRQAVGGDVAEAARRSRSFIGGWQVVVWTGWKPEYVAPVAVHRVRPVLARHGRRSWDATQITLQRGVERLRDRDRHRRRRRHRASRASKVLRAGVGSMITGLQTMPSIAWFPLAIVLFRPERVGDPVRRRARRGAVDRQRHHQRHRQRPADPAAGRPRARRARASRRCATS